VNIAVPEVSEVAVEQLRLHHARIEQLLLAFTPFEARQLTDDDVRRLEIGFLREAACLRPDVVTARVWWITDLGLDVLCKNR
jgi:hypothetical protein